MKEKKRKKSFFRSTMRLFRPFWLWLGVVFSLMLVGQVLRTLSPYFFGRSVDAVTHVNIPMTIMYLAIGFGFTFLQTNILPWIRESIELKRLDDHIEGELSHRMLEKMLTFSIGQHINEHSGVKQSVVNRGMSALGTFVDQIVYTILPNLLFVIATLVTLAFFDWRVAIISTMFVAVYAWLAIRQNKTFFPRIGEVRKKKQEQTKLQSEFFRNATLVISESQEERVSEKYRREQDAVTAFHDKTWLDFLRPYYANRLLIPIGQYASLGLGTYYIMLGQHSIGMFVTLFAWVGSVFATIETITNSQRKLLFQVVEIEKLYDLLEITPAIRENPEGVRVEPLAGAIEFKGVSFTYPKRKGSADEEEDDENEDESEKEEDATITDVSFTIKAGSKVGFVGISGSGKSTIVNLMRRYYDPTEGAIYIDGTDLRMLDLHWFRSKVGNVEQKIDLFDQSIRENVTFGLPKGIVASDADINRVIEDSSLGEFVGGLKEFGIDTYIGEGGIKVSGGERQRIGIARALIKDPKILIFDEATSALDSINEKLIHEAINRGSKGRTTIIIAHRLSTIMDADKIFVVAGGRIVGEGKHAELLQSCKEYRDLIEHQIFSL